MVINDPHAQYELKGNVRAALTLGKDTYLKFSDSDALFYDRKHGQNFWR